MNPHGATFCLGKYAPGPIFGHFLAKFLALFEKAAGRGRCIVAGHTPNSRGINIYIERASHNNIGCLGVSKNFWRKKGIFFWTSFFFTFSSEIFLWTNPHFFSKNKVKIWLEKQHVFFLFDPHWCQSHLESFCGSRMKVFKNLWNHKCSEIIFDHHAKKLSDLLKY